jgi:hypothetical protein
MVYYFIFIFHLVLNAEINNFFLISREERKPVTKPPAQLAVSQGQRQQRHPEVGQEQAPHE